MRAIALAPGIGSRRWISARAARVDGRLVDVTSTMSGRIDRILVAEGEPVEKGARLVELDHGVSGSTPDRVAILAPTRGRVLTRHLMPGDRASYGQIILTLVEDDDVWVIACFDAADFERIRRDIVAAVLLFLFLVLHSPPSLALQPVETFLAGAREGNPDELEARATALQQQGQALSALGRVLPGVAANGSYTRNQYSSAITLAEPGQPTQTVTLLPRDQWNGSATLTVPLVDLAGFRRVSAANASARAAAYQLDATWLQVQGQVGQEYYQLVADLALVAASRGALEVSREGLLIAKARLRAGAAGVLEVDRARADVEQQL